MVDAEAFPPDLPVFATIRGQPGAEQWRARLPTVVAELETRWQVRTGPPFHTGITSWTAPAVTSDGSGAVLKIVWPHPEARHEPDALAAWEGNGAVRLLASEPSEHALLAERCVPGDALHADAASAPAALGDAAVVLRALWIDPPIGEPFDALATVGAAWADLAAERLDRLHPPGDAGVARTGIELLATLALDAPDRVLLHGDCNPGNLLRATRAPRLAIDPKPMVGDPAYDPAPLLMQLDDPLEHADPVVLLGERAARLAGELGIDRSRLLAWALAREVEGALWSLEHSGADGFSLARAAVVARALG